LAGIAWVAGVDGCRNGWVVALIRVDGGQARVRRVDRFSDIEALPEDPNIIAVDIPIGLPDRIGAGGRGPEHAVRRLLG
jgi:predicted RNase H-like nuclease